MQLEDDYKLRDGKNFEGLIISIYFRVTRLLITKLKAPLFFTINSAYEIWLPAIVTTFNIHYIVIKLRTFCDND